MKRLLSLLVIFSLLLSSFVAFANASKADKLTNSPRQEGFVEPLASTAYQAGPKLLTLTGDNSPPLLMNKDNNNEFNCEKIKAAMNLKSMEKEAPKKNCQADEGRKESLMKEEYIFNIRNPYKILKL